MKNLQNIRVLIICCVFVLAVLFAVRGWPVPTVDETLYLLLPIKQYNVEFIKNDWTLSKPWLSHYLFNAVVGPVSLILPIEIVGWIGRLLCWSFSIVALMKIGKFYKLSSPLTAISLILWIIYGQSLVANEFVLSEFEAKSVAYVFLLYGLHLLLKKRFACGGASVGLAFSFHPIIGLWAIVGIIFGFFGHFHRDFKKIMKTLACAGVFAIPGIIFAVATLLDSSGTSLEEKKYLAIVVSPGHLDPASWSKRDILLVYILFIFNWSYFLYVNNSDELRFLILFQSGLCLCFSLGLVAYILNKWEFVTLMPFRLFPVFVPLFFFYGVITMFKNRKPAHFNKAVLAVMILSLMCLQNPIGKVMDQVKYNFDLWTSKESEIEKALDFVKNYSQNGEIIIAPPWRQDAWYLTRRAQIANWYHFPYDRLSEWRTRIESLVGNATDRESMERNYNSLSEIRINEIVQKYGGNYLVSKSDYAFPLIFTSETYKVYKVFNIENVTLNAN